MSLTGKAVKSHRKQDIINQKSPAVGFKKMRFAHKASSGDTGFNLNAMTVPTEMTANGFLQPSADELQAANLQFYKKNLLLFSSARGALTESLDYYVAGNGQIKFTDQFGTALQDEIFIGHLDPVVRTGSQIADTVAIVETGELAANTTDIPVGRAFTTNLNSTTQMGAVQVIVGGQTLLRNSGNATASASADGDYQEVDSGSGTSNLIRLNEAAPEARSYIIMSTQLSVVNGDGSLQEDLQRQQGTIDLLVDTVAELAGVPTTNFQGTPTQPLLKAFGERLVDVEDRAAYIDVSNAWTQPQSLVGITSGIAPSAGYIGERSIINPGASVTPAASGSFVQICTVTLTPGIWLVMGQLGFSHTTATGLTQVTCAISTSPTSADGGYTSNGGASRTDVSGGTTIVGTIISQFHRYFNVSVSTQIYLVGRLTYATLGNALFTTECLLAPIRIG